VEVLVHLDAPAAPCEFYIDQYINTFVCAHRTQMNIVQDIADVPQDATPSTLCDLSKHSVAFMVSPAAAVPLPTLAIGLDDFRPQWAVTSSLM